MDAFFRRRWLALDPGSAKANGEPRRARGGFSLLIVILVVGIAAMMGALVLDLVDINIKVGANRRLAAEALEIADGAVLEVLDDSNAMNQMPELTTPGLRTAFATPSETTSAFASSDRTFTADAKLVRIAPIADTSLSSTRALVYEIGAKSNVQNGVASKDAKAEVVRVVSYGAGHISPRVHAR